jgi:cytoskeletal protein RodZ
MPGRLPATLFHGRVRTSTLLLSLLFVATFALYLEVRPPPAGSPSSSDGAGGSAPAGRRPEPTSPGPATTSTETSTPGTTSPSRSTTSTGRTATTRSTAPTSTTGGTTGTSASSQTTVGP